MDNFESAKQLFMDGLKHIQCREYRKAEPKFRASLDLMPGRLSTMTNLSLTWINLHRYDEAENLVRDILALHPDSAEAWLNRGLIERDARLNLHGAIEYFERALTIRSTYAEAYLNRAIALAELEQYDSALADYDRAIALDPTGVEAYYNRATTLWAMGRHEDAVAAYDVAHSIDPDFEYLVSKRLHAKMHLCDWDDYVAQISVIADKIRNSAKAADPFLILSLIDDPELQRRGIETWVRDRVARQDARPQYRRKSKPEKIRLGYFSADFRNHAVANLIVEVLELHDRSRFEIVGFSYGPKNDSEMRRRLMRAFDMFHDVNGVPDAAIAAMSRDSGIDIAIDLTGYTDFARPALFAAGCAPVQVNYLGFPGTWGSAAVDYIIADENLIPDGDRQYYSEKVAYLPDTHMPHDRKRAISDRIYYREELGLPQFGTIFCCFNNIYKITPAVFESWMRILKSVDGSVLWLLSDNAITIKNLRGTAKEQGVDGSRLVFADRIGPADHLARYRVADIFLDTLPYNAHLTACDALWAGLPVVTCSDRVFVSRIATSVLCAAGLPELVADNRAHYEQLAVELAGDPARLAAIKRKLAENRLSVPLFDSATFTRYIEDAYTQMYQRCRDGLPPTDIGVPRALSVNLS